MANLPDIFNINTSQLADNTTGIDRLGVDQAFLSAPSDNAICIVCKYNKPSFKLIPKHKRHNTAEIQDKGYACTHCVSIHAIDPKDFILKELK